MLLIAAFVCVVAASFGILSQYLVLTSDVSGERVFIHSVDEGESFYIGFIHSVNISPVLEVFTVSSGRIYLTALEFETFGAGMPAELEPGQQLVHLPDGTMRIEYIRRLVSNFHILTSDVTEHTLHIAGQVFSINDMTNPGEPVRIEFQRLNIWQRIFKIS